MKKFVNFVSILLVTFLFTQCISATEYGQVVRFQCDRTGKYLSMDPTVDANGEYKIILQGEANDDTLWIIKGKIDAPVGVGNPYDRWNCVFGDTVPINGYEARIEHVITAYDARFGDYQPSIGGHTNPYSFLLGQTKISDSGAIHYYNFVLNLNGENKILLSNEYLCEYDEYSPSEAILTQDAVVDTWTIIPVYMMTDDLRTTEGQDLIDVLSGGPTSSGHDENQDITDCLIEDVTAIIDFYNNETTYSQEVKSAFTALATETDINQRISIVQGLEPHTISYNDQKAAVFGNIIHPTTLELITCINDLLTQNKTRTINLENDKQTLTGEKQALTDEITTVNNDLGAVGATSVPDLTGKIDQLVTGLNALW